MIVFPFVRLVGLNETLPMFVRSRPPHTRRTSPPSWPRSDTTKKSPARISHILTRLERVTGDSQNQMR